MRAKLFVVLICLLLMPLTLHAQVNERELQLPEQPQVSYVVDESNQLTASFGVASVQPSMNNVSELVTAADQALYKAKHSGRNKIILAPSL